MKQKKYKEQLRSRLPKIIILWMSALLCCVSLSVQAQNGLKKGPSRASRYSYLPSNYTQVGATQLYSRQYSEAIDMIGYYNGYYYSSTYSDYGYKLSVKVGENDAIRVDCLNGTSVNGVTVKPSIEQQGELARICYSVTNANEEDVVISMGVHADVMIGDNDAAPIERRIDTFGQTYGLTMKDGNGAQLCVLFGAGLAGVTAVSDFWFGSYGLNSDAYQMVGNYSSGDNYMVENGYYDSGMGWCWKERTITAGSTVVFAYVIGVGEVNLEPNSTFEVTPDDPEGWNDLSRPHRITLNGSYESPAGLDGVIDYAVEDSEEWTALTGTLKSGDSFTASLVAMFDATKATHVIRFRTRDQVGNTTLLHPIEYADVSFHTLDNIEEKTFTGEPLYQTNLTCDLAEEHYVITSYINNVNAGTASFNIEGVFPYTIGRKTHTFTINPQPLVGEVILAETSFVYNGQPFTPGWQFSNEAYATLVSETDFTTVWSSNTLPGTGTFTVTGRNNYSGTLTAEILIDKAPLTIDLIGLALPAKEIIYDELDHPAQAYPASGVGAVTLTYLMEDSGVETPQPPILPGNYKIYVSVADGELYYGMGKTEVGSVTISMFDTEQYALIGQMATDTETYHMYYEIRMALAQFLKSTSEALQTGDLSAIHEAFMPLESLLNTAQNSIAYYEQLAGYISYAQQLLEAYGSMFTDEIKATVTSTISDLQTAYGYGALKNEEIEQIWPQLQETTRSELTKFLTPYMETAQALIAQGLESEVYGQLTQALSDVQSLLTWNEYSIENATYIKNTLRNVRDAAVAAKANVEDLAILRQAYQAMGGATSFADLWQFETAPYILNNVSFNAGRITSISLSNYGITGSVPVSLFMLPKLNWLYLEGNNLSGDLGTALYALAQQNPSMAASLQELSISNNQLSGNLGVLANCLPALKTLRADHNCFEDVYPMIPATVTFLDISYQKISRVVPLNLSNFTAEDIIAKVPSILLYDHGNQTFATSIDLTCSTTDDSWSMYMLCQDGQLTIPWVSEQNTYRGENGDILNVEVSSGLHSGSTFSATLSFDEGDGNFDGKVNVLDLQTDILYIMENYLSRPFNFTAANLWKDETINVQDIISLVNLLMDMETGEETASARRSGSENNDAGDAVVYMKGGQLMLNTERPVAAFDIVVAGTSETQLSNLCSQLKRTGMTVSTKATPKGVRIIGYSLSGSCIPAGTTAIGMLGENASVSSAMLSDSDANAINVRIGGEATGVNDVQCSTLNVQRYDLQGRKLSTPKKGLYISNGHKIIK